MHTRASPDEIDGRESAGGQNFIIDIQNRNLRNRPPFDLIGQVPNAATINGGASLLKTDGTVTTLIQAGNTVYKWNAPSASFTSVGTCSNTCKLRGHWRAHVWNLTDRVIITDLSLSDPVYQWDGTTFSQVAFTDENNNKFGLFKAKYLSVQNERAIFANVSDASGNLPHMLVGSQQSNFSAITTNNTPSSALGTGDAFFLLAPDLKPINAYVQTYLGTMISTERGQIFNLQGQDATNFQFATFYAASSASGIESVCEIGSDFIYGRAGRIESIRDTNTFGNSEADDMTAIVADQVAAFTGWTIVFNGRTRKAYAFPTGVSEVWVLDAAIRDQGSLQGQGLSPWMRWRSNHSLAFRPSMVMSLLDPSDGLEYIFMGDSSGNLYRMEGTGTAGDGGTSNIDTQFLSKLISTRLDSKAYDVEGYVKYNQYTTASTLTLTFQYQGENVFANALTMTLAAAPNTGHYFSGAGSYFNSGIGFNTISGQLTRNKFVIPGHANEFQLLVEVIGNNNISINEIGIRLRAASS